MLFKDLKTGYPIFILDRNEIKVSQGKVVNVGLPHLDTHYGSTAEMVVDLTIENDGQTKTFSFKDGTEVGYINNLVISAGREGILREVEAIKVQAEQALSQVETNRQNLDKCTVILSDFNPAFKKEKETEERFQKLEQTIGGLEGSMGDLKEMIKGLVKELKG